MRIVVQFLLLILICLGPHSSVLGQQVVVEKSNNKVVVQGVKYYLHVVKEKETLFAISKAYGVSLDEIMRINNKKSAAVSIDEVLRIPEAKNVKVHAPRIVKMDDESFIYHKVKPGDTLFSLARKYKVSQKEIVGLNPGADVSLPLGSRIRIPKIGRGVAKELVAPQQEKQPKIEGNYYYHVVKEGDTEFSICRKFGMKLRKFRKLNPKVKREGLKLGTYVRIPKRLAPELPKKEEVIEPKTPEEIVVEQPVPVKEEPVEEAPVAKMKKKVSIALLLPLYLEANDTINYIKTYEDTVEIVKERERKIIYSRSQDFIRFYQGVLLAVDTLKEQGLSVDLHVFDTERSEEKVRKILMQPEMEEVDIILGPVYSNTFNVAAEFALQRHLPIVSPLSAKNSKLNTNPFVFQLNTGLPTLCDKLATIAAQDINMVNLVVVHQSKYKHLNEYKLVRNLEQELFEKGRYWNGEDISYKKISFDDYGLYGIEHTLSDTCENIILIPSTSQPIVDNYVTQLNVLSNRYSIRLMGFPVWKRYNSMDPENFFNLNTTLLSPYYIDYNAENVEKFVTRFRNNFLVEPNDFSFRAYDLCLFFSSAISQFGDAFMDHLDKVQPDLLQSCFQFERVGNFGGFENRGLHLINYSKNFQIISTKAIFPERLEEVPVPFNR